MLRARAFTLVEVLVCVAIVAIVAGILLPALVAAKRQAFVGVDTQNLRQIGVAIALYREDHGDPAPRLETLVAAGLVTKEQVSSPLDPTLGGLANATRAVTGMPPSPYKLSYHALRDATDMLLLDVLESRGAGLVASLAGAEYAMPAQGPENFFQGRYLRLLVDGAVQPRNVVWKERRSNSIWLFTDDLDRFPAELPPP